MEIVLIADDDELVRRLAPHQFTGDVVNSSAYKLSGKEFDPSISVDLARLVTSSQEALGNRPGFGLGVLNTGEVRSLGFTVRHDPVADNHAHALIGGVNSRVLARRLAAITRILLRPDG